MYQEVRILAWLFLCVILGMIVLYFINKGGK